MIQNLEAIEAIAGRTGALLLAERYDDMTELANAPTAELALYLGSARATRLRAALSIARSLGSDAAMQKPLLDTPDRVAELLLPILGHLPTESFWCLMVNTRRRLIKLQKLSDGTLDTLLVHPREVFKAAILANAAAIILAHNHPSGDPTPSEADVKVTRDLIRGGQLLKIDVLDHVVIGQRTAESRGWTSLRELGFFYS